MFLAAASARDEANSLSQLYHTYLRLAREAFRAKQETAGNEYLHEVCFLPSFFYICKFLTPLKGKETKGKM